MTRDELTTSIRRLDRYRAWVLRFALIVMLGFPWIGVYVTMRPGYSKETEGDHGFFSGRADASHFALVASLAARRGNLVAEDRATRKWLISAGSKCRGAAPLKKRKRGV